MAVTFDNAANAGTDVLTYSFACSGSERYLTVAVNLASRTVTVSGITYSGVAMTFLGRSLASSANLTAELWGLIAPATGSNTITITLSGAAGNQSGAISFNGVNQSTPTDGAAIATNGAGTPATSGTKTGAIGDMLVDTIAAANVQTVIAPSVMRWTQTDTSDGGATNAADGSAQTISWTEGDVLQWTDVVALIKQATGAGRVFRRFYGPALLANTAADLYTVPTGRRAVIRHIHVANPTASPVDFTLSIGADAAATRLWDGYPVPADELLQEFRDFTLEAGEKIQALASTASALNLTIDGYEIREGA